MRRIKSQKQRVLERLKRGEQITSLDAANFDPPIIDLPKRISELRRDGYDIKSETIYSHIGQCKYNRYYMEL